MTKPKVITLGLLALVVLAMLCAQRTMTAGGASALVAEPVRAHLSFGIESGKIVLRGGVPDVTLKQQLVAKAYQVFGAGNVVNQLTVEPNVRSEEWLPRASEVIQRLKNWGAGSVVFDGPKAALGGEVKTEAEKLKRQDDITSLLGTSARVESHVEVSGGGTSAPAPAAAHQSPAATPHAQTPSAPATAAAAPAAPAVVANKPAAPAPASGKPSPLVARIHDVMNGKTIDFEIGSATLTPSSAKLLDELVPIIQSDKDVKLEIGGHTDNYGDPKFNQMVSQARAVAVAQYLIGRGVDGRRLVSKGYGDSKPVANNKTRDGRRLNRRVTFQAL